MKPFISIVACLLVAFNSYSAPSQSTKIHSSYTSFRALGMGNAFTAVADDYSLIMYNPAGFAKKKHNEIQISLFGAGVSSKTTTLASDINTASNITGSDSAKAQAISDVLEKYYGQSLGGKVQALEMFWVRNGWGVALLPLDLTIDMSINRQVGPAIDLNVKGDTTIAFGYGTEVAKNFDAGVTVKYVHRVAVEEIVPAFELATDSNVLSDKRFKEGTAADFDIGIKWKPDWFNSSTLQLASLAVDKKTEDKSSEENRKPQAEDYATEVVENTKTEPLRIAESNERYPLAFGLVVHNVIGGEFTLSKLVNKNATEVPTKMYRVVDIGSEYLLRDGEDFKIRYMLDFKDLWHPEISLNKSFHTGLELDYSPSTWFKSQFRVGVNQMYYTAGASFLFGILNLDAVTYGEEVGTQDTKSENRVYAAKLGFNF
jgi:hypothetical protein